MDPVIRLRAVPERLVFGLHDPCPYCEGKKIQNIEKCRHCGGVGVTVNMKYKEKEDGPSQAIGDDLPW